MAKKYVSKIVKGGHTLEIKDEEARAAIEAIPEPASVATCESIIDELT